MRIVVAYDLTEFGHTPDLSPAGAWGSGRRIICDCFGESSGLEPELERLRHLRAESKAIGNFDASPESLVLLKISNAFPEPSISDGECLVTPVLESKSRSRFHS